jgi:glycerol transport system ATP-binding protein
MDLVAQNLTYKPGEEYHLNDVSFSMEKGQLYTILGRTLAGKTTLLKAIAGLLAVDSGSITHGGQDFGNVPVWQRNIAMVYQQFINYPHLSVYDNVAFPLRQRKLAETVVNDRVMASLQNVGLSGFESRKIQALSGGQQQRVALARSLAKEAGILLLDEPLVNLDYKLREQLREEFRKIFSSQVDSDSILIYSSTDPVEAMQLGGDIIVMDEARVLQQGPAKEVFENPATTRVAEIANDPAMNLVAGEIADGRIVINKDITLQLPAHFRKLSTGRYTFGIRAADVALAGKGIPFTVELSEISGSETYLHVQNGGHTLVGLLDMVKDFSAGEKVKLALDASKMYAFEVDGGLMSSPFGGGK